MPKPLIFYVSGHGYGHARRMTQVIRELLRLRPDVAIHVRSAAPARVFAPLPAESISSCDIDSGLIEIDPLTIDREKSIDRLQRFMGRRDAIVAGEVETLRKLRPGLIVADIPFLAGDVAAEMGVPCVGISNFTWDWIYQHLFPGDSRYEAVAGAIEASYAKMSVLLELPFGQTCPAIANKMAMPLVAMRSRREPADVLRQKGIRPDDRRPRVLIGTRGGLNPALLAEAATGAPRFLFLCPNEPMERLPRNGVSVPLGPGLDFSDVLLVSDVVVSKLGYGTVSECIATQSRLLWPARDGFVEDVVMREQAPSHLPMLEMDAGDYRAGRWNAALERIMEMRPRLSVMETNGAEVCARRLADWILGS